MSTERLKAKRRALAQAESDGLVADSMSVRRGLMQRVKAGELTLEQAQAELRRIQDSARSGGKETRSKVWREA